MASAPARCGMENFRKVQTCEEEEGGAPPPFPGLPAGVAEMKVKEGSKIRNLLAFAAARMEAGGARQIVFSGCGRAVTKTVTCVEILKRRLGGGLHQVTEVRYRRLREVWQREGRAERLTVPRSVPAICILLSKDPLEPGQPGYQAPQPRPAAGPAPPSRQGARKKRRLQES
ncbi:ribonuclease P protein subunit p25 [Rhinatrema bivittatum]|uniref:ribonuclease P protein subunit p25 n=1 Tax=Rhinatrema bivittatum TaxID=194408 RepID=UPI001129F118|nr:ribonuclease P protein subunit p25 [Rhinatrema bivittatum]